MSDLRTRIARVLYTRAMSRLSWHRNWDDLQPEVQQMWLDDADAVIRELGLHRENSYGYGTNYPKVPTVQIKYIRYVTDWSANG